MCTGRYSTGLVEDFSSSVSAVASVAAHELGHIFNMNHDDGRPCQCVDETTENVCIMAGTSSLPPATQWSSCSKSDLSDGFRNNLDRCLTNQPVMTVGDPVCGNGIIEEGEVCDCGTLEVTLILSMRGRGEEEIER